jgi:hypothetical protein
MARGCDDPVTADALRALAAEYMAEEAEPSASVVQQQQQFQPKEQEGGDKQAGTVARA